MKKPFLIITIITTSLIGLFFCLPKYTRNAIVNFPVSIDDQYIFESKTVKSKKHSPWERHNDNEKLSIPNQYLPVFKKYETTAYVIIKNGKLLFEDYYLGYNSESQTNSFSAAKSIVSLLVGIAIDEGFINDIDNPVNKYINLFSDNDSITIRNVLTMSSGSDWHESYSAPFSITTDAYYGTHLDELIYSLKSVEPSGKRFSYKSGDTQILATVVRAATGMELSDFAAQYLWSKIEAENNALWSTDTTNGTEKAFCCFNATAKDFAKIGQLVLDRGKLNGEHIISERYIEQMLRPASYLKDENGRSVDYYGFQWWILNHKTYTIPYARGILGQYIFIIPDLDMVIVRLGKIRSSEKINGIHPSCALEYIDAALEMTKLIL